MARSPARPSRAQVARQMQRAVGELTTTSLARMDEEMEWFRDLTAEERAWVGMVLQAGFSTFVSWFRDPTSSPPLTAEVFGNAPRSFAGVVSLQQTVAMIRVSIEVAEDELVERVSPETAGEVREAILRYGRELAFASADVYAHAAELRGAWDARLEALVVDSIMRGEADETVRTRAAALGWDAEGSVVVVVGSAPGAPGAASRETVVDDVRRQARDVHLDALGAVQGDRLVVVVGGVSDPDKVGGLLARHFGPGPVVVGPPVGDLLLAHHSAAAAVAGFRSAPGWDHSEDPVSADDLLAERALDGDELARHELVTRVHDPLREAGSGLAETLMVYLDHGGSVEGAARALFVHPNTVRYRLKRITEVTGLSPGDARHAFTMRVALVLGRLAQHPSRRADPTGGL